MDTNPYYLKNKQRDSKITNDTIRFLFELRHEGMHYQGNFERALSGVYLDSWLQSKWEEFYNGFRLGEDHA